MTETPASRRWVWWAVSAVAALGVLAGGWALTSGRLDGSKDPGNGLPAGTTADGSWNGSDGGTQTTSPAAESATKPGGGTAFGGGSTGSGGGAAEPGGSGSPPPGKSATSTTPAERGTFYVRIAWWNDTEARAPTGFVIKWGASGSWAPDATRRSQVGTIGPFVVGSVQSFKIYPDGTGGFVEVVPFTITSGMVSASEQDGVHVEVRDYSVFVLGNPVENAEINFPRP